MPIEAAASRKELSSDPTVGINQGDVVERLVRVAPAVNIYYIKASVSTVVLCHLFTNNPHIYFKLTRIRPLRSTNIHIPNHTSAYRWSNDGPARAR